MVPGVRSINSKASNSKADLLIEAGDKRCFGNLFLEEMGLVNIFLGWHSLVTHCLYVAVEGQIFRYILCSQCGRRELVEGISFDNQQKQRDNFHFSFFPGRKLASALRSVQSQATTWEDIYIANDALVCPAHDYKDFTASNTRPSRFKFFCPGGLDQLLIQVATVGEEMP
ncbi:putative Persulfide dioxygenase ETHE1, mitochondrial [Cocos nucifera]|uniref:Putative Persulfide dioxygenase ETHE1, mitochondrial n=1 Tax=Cocos nucifera TaxID=13894 RepID=A0A8K0I473_COCNU|nr:putative Persulfide dioxygenase ETHE1, mitochondrial [Cocos nucifera]